MKLKPGQPDSCPPTRTKTVPCKSRKNKAGRLGKKKKGKGRGKGEVVSCDWTLWRWGAWGPVNLYRHSILSVFYEREKSTHKKQSSHLLLELWVLASCWTFIPQKFRVRLICCSFLVGVCLLLCQQISKLIIAGKGVSRCNVLITCSFHFICSLTSYGGGGGGGGYFFSWRCRIYK